MPNEQAEFLKDLEPQQTADVFEQTLEPKSEVTEKVTEESDQEKFNRRERRLQAKLTAERESSIALAARLEALSEAQKLSRASEPSSFEQKVTRIYGTDTPENASATELLIASMKEAKEDAKREALEAFREELRKEREVLKKEEQNLSSMVEEIEDETGITLDAQTQKGFLQLLEKLSPKDKDGKVTAYADHHAVWEEYQARKAPVSNRAKDLASRSMVKTGASPNTTVEEEVTARFYREQGLI